MRRELLGREIGERQIADLLAGLRLFQELQRLGFVELCQVGFRLGWVHGSPIAEIGEGFEAGRSGRHPLGPKLLECQRVPGDDEQLVVPFLLPVLEGILVKQIQILGDLRLAEHLFVLLGARANHPGDECG